MHILVVGLNHKTAPIATRDALSFSKEQLQEALPLLNDSLNEAVVLSTCNRTEIYSSSDNPPDAANRIRRFLASYHNINSNSIQPHLQTLDGRDAVRHIFRVSSGLDSLIVGESQILGQVRESLVSATEAHSVQIAMIGLFHAAVRVGRRVREDTEVGRNATSVSFAGVKLAQRLLGDLQSLRVMVVGAGEAGALVAGALRTAGVSDIRVANRTLSRAEDLARELGATAVSFDNLKENMVTSDIVISATDSPDYILNEDHVEWAMAQRDFKPQFYFDLAAPRDIDPNITSISGISLYNIDDLSAIAEENLQERRRAAVHAEEIVDAEVEKFMLWWDALDALPIIKSMRLQADYIRQRELSRAVRCLPDLSAENVEILEALTRSIVNKVLHDPTIALKQLTDKSHLQAAKDLFGIWEQE